MAIQRVEDANGNLICLIDEAQELITEEPEFALSACFSLGARRTRSLSATLPPIRIEPKVAEQIQGAAHEAGISTSEAVRQILELWVGSQKQGRI